MGEQKPFFPSAPNKDNDEAIEAKRGKLFSTRSSKEQLE